MKYNLCGHRSFFVIVWFYLSGDLVKVLADLGAPLGSRILLDKVLCVGGKDFTLFGKPLLPHGSVAVEATVIEKSLSPLSDLFTPEFMNEERVGASINFEGIGPWLYDKILDYCVLFKSEYQGKHTNGYSWLLYDFMNLAYDVSPGFDTAVPIAPE